MARQALCIERHTLKFLTLFLIIFFFFKESHQKVIECDTLDLLASSGRLQPVTVNNTGQSQPDITHRFLKWAELSWAKRGGAWMELE